jgi:histidine triad (HIT) family protein
MAACIFCEVVAGRAERSLVLEDEATLAFMDVRQMSAGHTLVVPKRHVRDIFELDDATGAALMRSVTRVARAVRDALSPDGVNVWQSNGEAAGQEVFHVHFHVLPRQRGDEMLRFYPRRPDYPERTELDALAARIGAAVRD